MRGDNREQVTRAMREAGFRIKHKTHAVIVTFQKFGSNPPELVTIMLCCGVCF